MPKIYLRWGPNGMKKALEKDDLIVVVDIFRFSSAVITAISNGAVIIPAQNKMEAILLSKKYDAVISNIHSSYYKRTFSLSPQSFFKIPKGIKVVLISPNGAKCCRLARNSQNIFIGGFLNAKSISKHVEKLSKKLRRDATILAAGDFDLPRKIKRGEIEKQFINKNNYNFFSLEDFIGSGAIINEMRLEKTDDAIFAEYYFKFFRKNLKEILKDTIGGRFLTLINRENDIDYCLKFNKYKCVPKLLKEIITSN